MTSCMAGHVHDDSPFRGEAEDRVPSWVAVVPPLLAALAAFIVTVVFTLEMGPR